jgi:hypothetical protein
VALAGGVEIGGAADVELPVATGALGLNACSESNICRFEEPMTDRSSSVPDPTTKRPGFALSSGADAQPINSTSDSIPATK